MLTKEHVDDDFQMTLDEVQTLMRNQISVMAKSFVGQRRPEERGGDVKDALARWFVERAKFVPLRLTLDERKKLRLVDAALRGSTYVDRVDAADKATAPRRDFAIQRCLAATLTGIVTALDYDAGRQLAVDKDFKRYAGEFQELFEICRRYKIMNPDRLRHSYGKLIMLMQDAMSPASQEMLGFSVVAPIKTVYDTLDKAGALSALTDDFTATATMEITNVNNEKSKLEIRQLVKGKENALELLARKNYKPGFFSKDDVVQCLLSMSDNASYLNSNCQPIDDMIAMLERFFDPKVVGKEPADPKRSLAIFGGKDGARLTHSHERQYQYVLQTLSLWREILHEIFRLWTLAERDLLDEAAPYKWMDTGQGMHRLQNAPRVSKAMHGILYAVQQRLKDYGWVGSSVIHISDANVPNALVFIDKWNQVPRILLPIVQTLRHLDSFVAKNAALVGYVDSAFGSLEDAKVAILHSFFREGFDGSGGEDWFTAGSCVDARLTSSWNWCQSLAKRPFYILFRLAGFQGFDGQW